MPRRRVGGLAGRPVVGARRAASRSSTSATGCARPCADLAEEAAERDVVVVTHVSPVKAALAWALGVGDEISFRAYVAPASITTIATAGPRPSLHSFNGCAHLEQL